MEIVKNDRSISGVNTTVFNGMADDGDGGGGGRKIRSLARGELASLLYGTSKEFTMEPGVVIKKSHSPIDRVQVASLEMELLDRVKDNSIIVGLINLLTLLVNASRLLVNFFKSSIILSCLLDYLWMRLTAGINFG
uniref:Uncharacterized protein n=1 Tax=Bracon brevicornis TaxID=1563983 RepID=A0A6V7M797_9HYME